MSSFELKMSEEINRSVESDRSDLFDYCDSTSSVEYILAFAHALDETYAEKKKKESIRRLQFKRQRAKAKFFTIENYRSTFTRTANGKNLTFAVCLTALRQQCDIVCICCEWEIFFYVSVRCF